VFAEFIGFIGFEHIFNPEIAITIGISNYVLDLDSDADTDADSRVRFSKRLPYHFLILTPGYRRLATK